MGNKVTAPDDVPGNWRLARRALLKGVPAAAAAGLAARMAAPMPVAAQDATPSAEVERSVAYGEAAGDPLLLDACRLPTDSQPRPAVVLLPDWGESRFAMARQAKALTEAGYAAFVVAYRWEWPGFIDDAQLAVRWIRTHAADYGVDPERVCAYGHGTGGQLAAMLAARDTRDGSGPALSDFSSRVDCAVVLAGLSDVTIPDPRADANEWIAAELGGTAEEAPDAYREVSPVSFVDAETAPMLVVHGDEDGTIPIEHSQRLVAALEEAGVEVVYAEIPDANHIAVVSWAINGPHVLSFLEEHLRAER
jgi:dipeptidyl aminopeptidase/acylaminoacyl peptidase